MKNRSQREGLNSPRRSNWRTSVSRIPAAADVLIRPRVVNGNRETILRLKTKRPVPARTLQLQAALGSEKGSAAVRFARNDRRDRAGTTPRTGSRIAGGGKQERGEETGVGAGARERCTYTVAGASLMTASTRAPSSWLACIGSFRE